MKTNNKIIIKKLLTFTSAISIVLLSSTQICIGATDSKAISIEIGNSRFSTCEGGVCNMKKLDCPPEIKNGRTFLPARAILEEMGAKVFWNSSQNQVIIENDGKKFVCRLGGNIFELNGKSSNYEVSPYIKNNRTMLPLRLLSETLGYHVVWNDGLISISK